MVVFAITQQNVINAAQGLARGQPKFNGTHLTAISIAAHFELVMLREKKPWRNASARVLGAALCVSCIQDRRHGSVLYKRGRCSSTRGHSLTLGKFCQRSHLCTIGKNILYGSSISMTSICQISPKIGTNGANSIIFLVCTKGKAKRFILSCYCFKQLILFWVLLAFNQHKHLL